MEHFYKVFKGDSRTTLLLAPPAWGKTKLIRELVESHGGNWVLLFPLKAIVAEVFQSFQAAGVETYFLRAEQLIKPDRKNKVFIGTPESFLLVAQRLPVCFWTKSLFVLDEFHLTYWWGDSFRAKLIECWQFIAGNSLNCVLMTATMRSCDMKRWQEEALLNFKDSFILNLGYNCLLTKPTQTLFYAYRQKSKLMKRIAFSALMRKEKALIFVKTKKSVEYWASYFAAWGLNALPCHSELRWTQEKLDQAEVIVSTTVLGHGVNISDLKNVVLSYELDIDELKYQLIARAGRRQESYHLFQCSYQLRDTIKGQFDYYRQLTVYYCWSLKSLCKRLKALY